MFILVLKGKSLPGSAISTEARSSGQKILCYPLSCSRFGLSLGQPGELRSWLSRLFVSQLSCQENDFCNCVSLMCQEIDKSSQPS